MASPIGANLRGAAVCLAVAGLLTACGGPSAAPTSAAPPDGQPTAATATATHTTSAAPSQPPAGFTPGSVPYRIVNLGSQPVDVYARSQGLVQAWTVEAGLEVGGVTDYFAPPDPGTVVITTAGSGDPTCVGTCGHFLASIGNTSGSSRQSTVVIHPEGVTEYWEQPNPEDVGQTANALPPNDTASAMVFAIGRAVTGADFGLRLAFAGEAGCAVDVSESNLLVGGTSVLVYSFDVEAEVTIHDSTDRSCDQPALGGPFSVTGEPGSRTLLLLFGSPGELDALVLPIPQDAATE